MKKHNLWGVSNKPRAFSVMLFKYLLTDKQVLPEHNN